MAINVDPPVGNLITPLLMVPSWKPPEIIPGNLFEYDRESATVGHDQFVRFDNVPRCSQASNVVVTIELRGDFSQQVPHVDPPPTEIHMLDAVFYETIVSGLDTIDACAEEHIFRIDIPRSQWNDFRPALNGTVIITAFFLRQYNNPENGDEIITPECLGGNTFKASIFYIAEEEAENLEGEMEIRSANLTMAGSLRAPDPHHLIGKLRWDWHSGGHVCIVKDRESMSTVIGGCVGIVHEEDGSEVAFTAFCGTGDFRGSVVSFSTVGLCIII